MKKVSVIVPCFNEEETIDLFYNTIKSFWKDSFSDHELELVFVDDGSKDATYDRILALSENGINDSAVKYFTRTVNYCCLTAVCVTGVKSQCHLILYRWL